ncbi:MAG TPA: type I-C CRISPR-associated protein Cas8c/Csd1 [Desulfobacteraceae bacterium]|nr:type I-C CRISPR-associated protein Cas8c/Csd1 [Desulfobacteraceae bacterium]
MILQALYALYGRLKDDPAYEIAPPGYSLQKITFKVVLRPDGTLLDIQDVRIQGRPRPVQVLGSAKPSGIGLNPCFLWDNTGYMLGFKPDDEDPERSRLSFEAFRKRHLDVESSINAPAFSSVCRFLGNWSPDRASEFPLLNEIKSGFGVFQHVGEERFIHQDPVIDAWWRKHLKETEEPGPEGECLLTGRWKPIARLQPMIKGVASANAQASLVGFNDPAYWSYGKEQSFNAPVSEEAAFEYGSSLNSMLDGPMKSKHRMLLADGTVAFWTDKPSLTEDIFAQFAEHGSQSGASEESQDEGLLHKLEIFLRALRQGVERYSDVDEKPDQTRFYLLGLSPNQGRLSVRFFLQGTIRELLDNLRKHYRDTGIERQYGEGSKRPDPEFPTTRQLLDETCPRDPKTHKPDRDKIPPILSGPLLRAVITGSLYPDGLYAAVIRRIHADREINYPRASIIIGWLWRNHKKEVSMCLDEERTDPAYRLGRLFSALEKTQEDVLGSLNASIRDRFYGAASATPQSVFPRLLRTYQHHLSKMEGGLKVNREKLVQEILCPVSAFPAHLNLAEQGLFALGYYHQRHAFFQKKGTGSEN